MVEHRNFTIERRPQSALWRIKWEGGGRLPKELDGSFTGLHRAQAAIDRYQEDQMRAHEAKMAKRTTRNKPKTEEE